MKMPPLRAHALLDIVTRATIVWALIVTVGCARRVPQFSYVDLLSNNRVNLQKLEIGMSRGEVDATMGTTPSQTRNGLVPNPYEREISRRNDGYYEVLYYLVQKYPPFTPIKRSQATPVVLRNGKVIGWGTDALDSIDSKDAEQSSGSAAKPRTRGE
jgi:Protein of unknown function (DUF3192)